MLKRPKFICIQLLPFYKQPGYFSGFAGSISLYVSATGGAASPAGTQARFSLIPFNYTTSIGRTSEWMDHDNCPVWVMGRRGLSSH